MVCSICGQSGHNRRTCPQRNTTGSGNSGVQPTAPHNPPPNRRALTRKLWRTTIKSVLDLKRFIKMLDHLH